MKKLVSLVLVLAVVAAMVCAFAVNATAEEESAEETSAEEEAKVIEPNEFGSINIFDAGNYILKNGQYSVGGFLVNSQNCVLTIPKDAVVTVEKGFDNFGTLYVYGTLIMNTTNAFNKGTIHVYGTLSVNSTNINNNGAIRVHCSGAIEGAIESFGKIVRDSHEFDENSICKKCGYVDPENHKHNYVNGVCVCGKTDGTILSGAVWYTLTENDTGLTLVIGGEGDMPNFPSLEDRPWHNVAGNITAVVINSGVTSIGMCAFTMCSSLKEVTIPGTVTSIGDNAFDSCSSLKEVTIPASVTSIGDNAFFGCDPNLVIHGKIGTAAAQYAKENGIDFYENGNCKHFAHLVCETCQAHLTGSQLLQAWEGDDLSGSTISGGNLAIIVGIAALVIGLGGGFLLGRKKRKPAVAGGNNEKTATT